MTKILKAPEIQNKVEVDRIFTDIVPIWSKHTEIAKSMTKGAVGDLLNQFTEIVGNAQDNLDAINGQEAKNHKKQIKHELQKGQCDLNAALENLNSNTLEGINEAKKLIENVIQQLGDTGTQFDHLTTRLQSNNEDISNQINEALVTLQFEDRISQMLELVTSKQEELCDHMEKCLASKDKAHDFSIDSWVQEMESSYNMEDQRAESTDIADLNPQGGDIVLF